MGICTRIFVTKDVSGRQRRPLLPQSCRGRFPNALDEGDDVEADTRSCLRFSIVTFNLT